ncbi:MAG: non-homologous end-joining DNA ligase [Acidimicrobiales bacterium]
MGAGAATVVEVGGRQLSLSNLDKVLYPEAGFTKGQVIDYYSRISPVLVPHLRQHPLTLKRYPNGVHEKFFFEKNCPSHRPPWVPTVAVWSSRNQDHVNYCLIDETAAVVWVANLAALELHPSLSLAADIDRPATLVFDLDPGAPAALPECTQVAMWLRELFDGWGIESFPKTSGSKGLQIYVPLNTEDVTYETTKGFAHALARLLEARHPRSVVSVMKKELRKAKVFIDWSQNDSAKTTIGVYSLRAMARPSVSTPVTWDEVAGVAGGADPASLVFEADAVLERVATNGDLFAPVLTLRQTLPAPPPIPS